jgi:hypothetical protein
MGRGVTPKDFEEWFCARVKVAMETAGMTPKQVAAQLGVEVDTMRRYTNRLLMPHHLIAPFCEITGTKPEFFFRNSAPIIEGKAAEHRQDIRTNRSQRG